jgi:hypothetical protein
MRIPGHPTLRNVFRPDIRLKKMRIPGHLTLRNVFRPDIGLQKMRIPGYQTLRNVRPDIRLLKNVDTRISGFKKA